MLLALVPVLSARAATWRVEEACVQDAVQKRELIVAHRL